MVFPRTLERLVSTIDVVEYNFAPPWSLSVEQQQWIHNSVINEGLGLILIHMGWRECLADPILRCNRAEDWVNSVLYPSFPMDIVLGELCRPSRTMEVVQMSPVVDLPGFEMQSFGPGGPTTYIGLVRARSGATVHARWKIGGEDAIVSWEYGTGFTLSIPVSGSSLGDAMREWKYFIDHVLNRVYVAANVSVPEDPELSHSLRAAFQQFNEQRFLVINLIDFVDKFGANTRPLSRIVDNLEGVAREANSLYVAGDYQGSLNKIGEAMEGLLELSAESTKVRKRALLWVYLTEWIIVTGTSMVCGWLVWVLMVERRRYRNVKTTRLSHR